MDSDSLKIMCLEVEKSLQLVMYLCYFIKVLM